MALRFHLLLLQNLRRLNLWAHLAETKFPVQNKISIEKYHAANVNGKLHSIEFAFPVRSLKVFIIIYSHGLCVHFTVEDSRDMIREKIDIYKIHTDCHEQSKNLIENELKHMD